MLRTISVDVPAKINLTLEILRKRADGYHDLRSVLVPVSLFESVSVTETACGNVTCETVADGVSLNGLDQCPAGMNLAEKAAALMKRLSGVSRGCAIRIVKRTPIGAGMGGGSADAAGVLKALRRLWMPDMPQTRLLDAAAEIGSDVPAMLYGGAVVVEGKGERISPVFGEGERAAAPFWMVVVFPGIPISSAKAYSRCIPDLTHGPELCQNIVHSVKAGDVREACRWLFNGFQNTVGEMYPETERFCLALREVGLLSSTLAGSGSAVFGLAESRKHAERAASRLPRNVWSRVVSTLPDGVMAAHGPLTP